MTDPRFKREIKIEILAAILSIGITFILGSLFSCSLYKWLHELSNPKAEKLAEAIKNVLGGIECYFEDSETSCENYQVSQPSREDVFKTLAELRKLEQHYRISIDLTKCPYVIVGEYEGSESYYYLTVAKVTEIMNNYQEGNSELSMRLIVENRESKKRLTLKPLPVKEIVPRLVDSVNQGHYLVFAP